MKFSSAIVAAVAAIALASVPTHAEDGYQTVRVADLGKNPIPIDQLRRQSANPNQQTSGSNVVQVVDPPTQNVTDAMILPQTANTEPKEKSGYTTTPVKDLPAHKVPDDMLIPQTANTNPKKNPELDASL